MNKHTPGPWRYLRVNGTSKDFNIVNDTGGLIALCPYEDKARLIAAAPDLLEALELAQTALHTKAWNARSYYVESGEYQKDLFIINSALAKAKGESRP